MKNWGPGSRRSWLMVGTVLLLVSMACAIPGLSSQEAPAGAPGAAGQVTQPPTPPQAPTPPPPAPPVLVETQPLPQGEVPLLGPLTLYFNQAMDRASVEGALRLDPAITGKYQWLDDASVSFIPDAALQPGAKVTVQVDQAARGKNGLALPAPVRLTFRSADYLRTTERLPKPGTTLIDPSSAVVVTFNQPVVPLNADVKTLPAAFTLQPEVNGRGEWLNTSTYIFYPDPAMGGGVQYRAVLNAQLVSVNGSPFAPESNEGMEWSFTTAKPRLDEASPSEEMDIALDEKFVLTFNQAMDAASVEENLSLSDEQGRRVLGIANWNEAGNELTFQAKDLLARNSRYTLLLGQAARSLGGAALGSDFRREYRTVSSLMFTDLTSGEMLELYQGMGSFGMVFNIPLGAKQDLSQLIRITPAVQNLRLNVSEERDRIFVSGFFEHDRDYTITVSADLRDQWGQTAGKPVTRKLRTTPETPSLSISLLEMGRTSVIYIPSQETGLTVQTVGISRVQTEMGALPLNDFVRLAAGGRDALETYMPAQASNWSQTVSASGNRATWSRVNLSETGEALLPGVYYYHLLSPDLTGDHNNQLRPFLVAVGSAHVTLKVSNSEAFVWVVDLDSQTPLANVAVQIYDAGGNLLKTLTTDANGIGRADLPGGAEEDLLPLAAVVGQPGQEPFGVALSSFDTGVTPWSFGVSYQNLANRLAVYGYTDRPIYRLGQTVYFRGTIHRYDNGRYQPADLKQVTLKVLGAPAPPTWERPVLFNSVVPVSAYGTLNSSLQLPAGGTPGNHQILIEEVEGFSLHFEVAEYRKPEIELQAAFNQTDWRAGEDVSAKLTARYYFGAPAAKLPMHWYLYARQDNLYLPEGYRTGKHDIGWMLPYWMYEWGWGMRLVAEGQGSSGPEGTLLVNVPADKVLGVVDSESLQKLYLEVSIDEPNGMPVSVRTEAALHPGDFVIGIRPDSWSAVAKTEIGFNIRTADWQLYPAPNRKLSAQFSKMVWKGYEWSGLEDSTALPGPEVSLVASADLQTGADGQARLAFTPPEPGTYLLDVHGDGAVSQVLVWVGGAGSPAWPVLPDDHLRLTADSERYKPGQTAKIFIPNPLGGTALALLTVERGKVMRSQVIQVQDSGYQAELPLTEEDAPNVYVSVLLLGREENRSVFRMGYQEIVVDPVAQVLKVELLSQPVQARPGEEVSFTVRVSDANGKPVRGEFSLGLVDKALLALRDPNAPDILKAFYGEQPLGVRSGMTLAVAAQRTETTPPGGRGGGGDTVPFFLRQDFRDTAYWNPVIETDANGVAEVRTKLPDNLTTWVADVRGLTVDARVGQARAELVTNKDLMIRPVTPRFLVNGDRIQLAAFVHNNTKGNLDVDVTLKAVGVTLEDPAQASQRVAVPAGESKRLTWWCKVDNALTADLVFSARAGNLQDAARPTWGDLPVLSYSSPQTFSTTGILPEGGERIEVVGLPRSFVPNGGELNLELSPSLAAAVLEGLDVLEDCPYDLTEATLSRLLPNVATYQAFKQLNQAPAGNLDSRLRKAIDESVARLAGMQNEDGGWGWRKGSDSDRYLTAYVLLGLTRASEVATVDANQLESARKYLQSTSRDITLLKDPWQLDREVFINYALVLNGASATQVDTLYEQRSLLNPWATAMLAMILQRAGDARGRTLISDLEASAIRSATGASWQDVSDSQRNFSSPKFNTAVVVLALAQIDPGSQVLNDAVRYLVSVRQGGGWSNSYETSWALLALVEVLKSNGDLQASYSYTATLNGLPLVDGNASGAQVMTPVLARVPLSDLRMDSSNILRLERSAGSGRLYYRAQLQISRPVESAPAVQRGMTIDRRIYRAGQDCRKQTCLPLNSIGLSERDNLLVVRLTLVVPTDMYYVVVEDSFPAGGEAVNPHLETSPQFLAGERYNNADPFGDGWGWWYFGEPQFYDQRVRWMSDYLPAGTYELTYRLSPLQAGEFRMIPARAWQYYFPEVQASSAGQIFSISE